jgi:hypothetical protein
MPRMHPAMLMRLESLHLISAGKLDNLQLVARDSPGKSHLLLLITYNPEVSHV